VRSWNQKKRSMQHLENNDFENKWKNAFADAEAEPNDALWLSIENHLAANEGIVMRGKISFYRWVAAASVFVALLLGGITIVTWNGNKNEMARNMKKSKVKEYALSPHSQAGKAQQPAISDKQPKLIEQPKVRAEGNNSADVNVEQANDPTRLTYSVSKQGKLNYTIPSVLNSFHFDTPITRFSAIDARHFLMNDSSSAEISKPTLSIKPVDNFYASTLNNPFALSVIRVKGKPLFDNRIMDDIDKPETIIPSKVESKRQENWWAAVGGSAGAYLPQTVSSTGALGYSATNQAAQPTSSDDAKVGTSFTFGVLVGKKVTKRWVVITGVNYLIQSIGYTSNQNINGAYAIVADISTLKNTVTTSPYTVNSVNEFVSVPLLAGYQLVQRKIGWQLNAGVASDIFLRNSQVDPTGKLSTYTEGAGDSSPYQTVNWTGIVGSEFSYRISSHYRFALVPGIRYSFQAITKPTAAQTINPLVGDVGFRFRYIF
jgi:hypothetical protein